MDVYQMTQSRGLFAEVHQIEFISMYAIEIEVQYSAKKPISNDFTVDNLKWGLLHIIAKSGFLCMPYDNEDRDSTRMPPISNNRRSPKVRSRYFSYKSKMMEYRCLKNNVLSSFVLGLYICGCFSKLSTCKLIQCDSFLHICTLVFILHVESLCIIILCCMLKSIYVLVFHFTWKHRNNF